jgi:hypothetical protein
MEREVDRIPRYRVVEFFKIKTVKPLRSYGEVRSGIVYAVVPREFVGKTAIVYIIIIRESTTTLERVVP